MTTRIRVVKKEDRNPPDAATSDTSADPKEWSSAVKSWVKEFRQDRREDAVEEFSNLFDDSAA